MNNFLLFGSLLLSAIKSSVVRTPLTVAVALGRSLQSNAGTIKLDCMENYFAVDVHMSGYSQKKIYWVQYQVNVVAAYR